jgi:hypothetical protein
VTPSQQARADMFAAFWRWIAAEVAPHLPPGRPGRPFLTLIRENADMLIYSLTLPAATAVDVTAWQLSETVEGVETIKAATAAMELGYTDGAVVSLKVRAIDDAGNASEWSPSLDFTANDTIAPPASGAPGVVLLREE